MLKPPDAPSLKKNTLRLFTRAARDNSVRARSGRHGARASYHGQNNGFEEWRIKRTGSNDDRKLVRALVKGLRREGRVKFSTWTVDLDFPKPSLISQCRLRGSNSLGSCSI